MCEIDTVILKFLLENRIYEDHKWMKILEYNINTLIVCYIYCDLKHLYICSLRFVLENIIRW